MGKKEKGRKLELSVSKLSMLFDPVAYLNRAFISLTLSKFSLLRIACHTPYFNISGDVLKEQEWCWKSIIRWSKGSI